ncbi:hypothetical protein SDC9_153661 [bioreactor metagenome]|uniref:Uncharacterized protein n=1 Tax=bioreactor metagenome TaxID=1076179 RepID=A0A645EWK9_9ZZZZ
MVVCGFDHVGFDGEVFVDEIGWIGVVGVDAANLGGCQEYVVGLFFFKECFYLFLAG